MLYDIILADPPWKYNSRSCGGEVHNKTRFGGGAEKHYPLLYAHEIIDPAITMDVKALKATDCHLLLWVTMPMIYDTQWKKPTNKLPLPNCAETVIKGWGFDYATALIVWNKTTQDGQAYNYGPGSYTAPGTELLFVCGQGHQIKPAEPLLPSIINAPVREHSRKPEEAYRLIERLYPTQRKIELFARTQRPGWNSWGNQTDKFNYEGKTHESR